MAAPLRLAILGSGIFATEAHVPAVLKNSSLSLGAVWSRSKASVDKLAQSDTLKGLNVVAYHGDDGLKELLASKDVEAVIIALPIAKQHTIVLQALEAGKHVLSEKPIAKDVATAKSLIDAYESKYQAKGIVWRIGENWAHEPSVLFASKLLASPALGPLLSWSAVAQVHLEAGTKWHATEWRTVPDFQGGFLLDGGVHQPAGLRCILGSNKPTRIISRTNLHRTHLGPHDTIHAIAYNENEVPPHGKDHPLPTIAPQGIGKSSPTGTFSITWAAPRPAPVVFTFMALNGIVTYKFAGPKQTVLIDSPDDKVKALLPEGEKVFASSGVDAELEQFARAVRGGKVEQEVQPRDALWDLAFMEACFTSGGVVVDLEGLAA